MDEAHGANTHHLKIWTRWFDAVESGDKTFEIRLNDRDYQVGDTLVLQEYRHAVGEYTGRTLIRTVSYVQTRDDASVSNPIADAIAPGYCVLGLKHHSADGPTFKAGSSELIGER